MKKLSLIFFIFTACNIPNPTQTTDKDNSVKVEYDFTTVFEKSKGTETGTYSEIIAFYESLNDRYNTIILEEVGKTDSGEPLHIVWYSKDRDFTNNNEKKTMLLINNGIHPGESDGIDATQMLFRDLAKGTINAPNNVTLAAIVVYNVGGCLNRNTGTRANQNGPKEYGFRGNSRNYDLNRDFIKSDTENARTFASILHRIKPDVFIDNHVSNGANYQYTLTHLFTQHNKLGGPLGNYLHKEMVPGLEQKLKEKKLDITPYVNVWGTTPEAGWSQFMDYPRYSTGYTTLFNTLGMMVETHMLKPYKDRVEQTYELMESMIRIMEDSNELILNKRKEQLTYLKDLKNYTVDWTIDSTQTTKFQFKGFEGSYIDSKVTGQKRLFYDETKPYSKEVTYYNYMKPKTQVSVPKAYIIPKAWSNVTKLLKLNNIKLNAIEKDTTILVESYKIKSYKTRNNPYEGHYLHYNTEITKKDKKVTFSKGDYFVSINPENMRYLMETLEPVAPDSFFNWNYFDTILQQKEHFSSYVFEDEALELLNKDEKLKNEFENLKAENPAFANSGYAQLNWIYQNSNHYEEAHLQYPIYRLK